tara:strand:+ start:2592 stop:6959 length:4368 start_codon:yes stop_codon:yes gene_type:complete
VSNTSKYFESDTIGNIVKAIPVVVLVDKNLDEFGAFDGSYTLIDSFSTGQVELEDTDGNKIYPQDILGKISSIKNSINFESKKIKTNLFRFTLYNYYDIITKLTSSPDYYSSDSDPNKKLMGTDVLLFYSTTRTRTINLKYLQTGLKKNHCSVLFSGSINRVTQNDESLRIQAEDPSTVFFKETVVPTMRVKDLDDAPDPDISSSSLDDVVPMIYGEVDRCPSVTANRLLIHDNPSMKLDSTYKTHVFMQRHPSEEGHLYFQDGSNWVCSPNTIYFDSNNCRTLVNFTGIAYDSLLLSNASQQDVSVRTFGYIRPYSMVSNFTGNSVISNLTTDADDVYSDFNAEHGGYTFGWYKEQELYEMQPNNSITWNSGYNSFTSPKEDDCMFVLFRLPKEVELIYPRANIKIEAVELLSGWGTGIFHFLPIDQEAWENIYNTGVFEDNDGLTMDSIGSSFFHTSGPYIYDSVDNLHIDGSLDSYFPEYFGNSSPEPQPFLSEETYNDPALKPIKTNKVLFYKRWDEDNEVSESFAGSTETRPLDGNDPFQVSIKDVAFVYEKFIDNPFEQTIYVPIKGRSDYKCTENFGYYEVLVALEEAGIGQEITWDNVVNGINGEPINPDSYLNAIKRWLDESLDGKPYLWADVENVQQNWNTTFPNSLPDWWENEVGTDNAVANSLSIFQSILHCVVKNIILNVTYRIHQYPYLIYTEAMYNEDLNNFFPEGDPQYIAGQSWVQQNFHWAAKMINHWPAFHRVGSADGYNQLEESYGNNPELSTRDNFFFSMYNNTSEERELLLKTMISIFFWTPNGGYPFPEIENDFNDFVLPLGGNAFETDHPLGFTEDEWVSANPDGGLFYFNISRLAYHAELNFNSFQNALYKHDVDDSFQYSNPDDSQTFTMTNLHRYSLYHWNLNYDPETETSFGADPFTDAGGYGQGGSGSGAIWWRGYSWFWHTAKNAYPEYSSGEDPLTYQTDGVVEKPCDIILHILSTELGYGIKEEKFLNQNLYNSDSFTESREVYKDWKMGFCQDKEIETQKLIQDILKETQSFYIFNSENKFTLINIKSDYNKYLDINHVIIEEDVIKYSIDRTKREDVVTSLECFYGWDNGFNRYGKSSPPVFASDYLSNYNGEKYYNMGDISGQKSMDLRYHVSLDTVKRFQKFYVLNNCNQHLIIDITLPVSYSNIKIGDKIRMPLMNNTKAFGIDYNKVQELNGQIVYPLWLVTEVNYNVDAIKIKAYQLHKLTTEASIWDDIPPEPDEEDIIGDEIPSIEDISGCTNPDATNYNPDATIDDGSCELPPPDPVDVYGNWNEYYTESLDYGVNIHNWNWEGNTRNEAMSGVGQKPEDSVNFTYIQIGPEEEQPATNFYDFNKDNITNIVDIVNAVDWILEAGNYEDFESQYQALQSENPEGYPDERKWIWHSASWYTYVPSEYSGSWNESEEDINVVTLVSMVSMILGID